MNPEEFISRIREWRLEEMDDEEAAAIKSLLAMPRQELDQVPFEICRWRCKVKLCKHTTAVRDYGLNPYFFHTRFGWIDRVQRFFICGGHSKAWRKRWGKDPNRAPLRPYWGGDDTVKPEIIY
jgi:hypothetical protein